MPEPTNAARKLTRPAQILLVEDNADDVFLTKRCFEKSGHEAVIHHVSDGEDCLEFLEKRGRFEAVTTPDLILLDLNLPKLGGREVLSRIANDPKLRHLPVVVLSTSAAQKDILEMYRLRCSSYVVKPLDLGAFQKIVNDLANHWFSIAALPTSG